MRKKEEERPAICHSIQPKEYRHKEEQYEDETDKEYRKRIGRAPEARIDQNVTKILNKFGKNDSDP